MKKTILYFMLLLLIPIVIPVVQAASSYDLIVEENGNALVILQIEGKGTFNVPLPLDVTNPAVKGGLYVHTDNGIDVSIGSTGKAVIVYKTSLLTSKKGEEWTFEMDTSAYEQSTAIVSLPSNTVILLTEPSAAISQSAKYLKISWDAPKNQTIKAVYSFGAAPIQVGTTSTLLVTLIVVLVTVILFLVFVIFRKTRKPEKVGKAKTHILKTLSGNEAVIVSLLIENKGSMKRNKLEKESKLAKSSLASALNALERKNIVRVDKTYTVHFIELTDWFKGLR